MRCTCCIVPADVLERLARDPDLSDEVRSASARTLKLSARMRELRFHAAELTSLATLSGLPPVELASAPAITVYDCKHNQTLPGALVARPGSSADPTATRTSKETARVAEFFRKVFDRNSIDNAGMTMMSSIHYGVKYNNAMWNGTQMVYGDGDGAIFLDFTGGNDVMGHELTHGVTQYSLQLAYSGDAGGLNESMSDCFGAMFRQWEAGQDAKAADWLIGHDIMGPTAKTKGYTCLRDMADPGDPHCLAPQPAKYSEITPGMDPHYTSGPPNLAFCAACKALGGKSWETIGQLWYKALTGFGPSPNMKMKDFAARTRKLATQMYGSTPAVASAVDKGWKQAGL